MQDKQFLIDLAHTKMSYGKFKGRYLIDLPEHYIVWYHTNPETSGPKGKIGMMLGLVYELKLNGLEYLIRNIQKNSSLH